MNRKTAMGLGFAALLALIVGTWSYNTGYQRGKRETLFRFVALMNREVSKPGLRLQPSAAEEQAEKRVYDEISGDLQHVVAQILQETGKPQMTADDLRSPAK